jgi:XTP/dITP diphosphohydrolase
MLKFILASGNEHKADEFSKLFDPEVLQINAASEKVSVVEDGVSFHENALKKASHYYEKFKTPVVSDDSGLSVLSLPDELGIHSARFGGEGLSDQDRCELLLKKLEGVKNRSAYFVCVLCFYLSPKEVYFFEGRMMGSIHSKIEGSEGFGYDPVFLPEGLPGEKTVAQESEWKAKNSHRAQASVSAQRFFRERVCQSPLNSL